MKLYPLGYIFLVSLLSGCAASTYNVIDITDNQWIEDPDGNLCVEKQMIIEVDRIVYFYENCPIRRVVRPKPHILPPNPYDHTHP
jgi:hypothetical protein